jgi:16S rRNA (cytidine1402-2'-O)-methyltransferase
VAVCRELTKLHEEVVRGSARELAERFSAGARGEITLVIEGRSEPVSTELSEDELDASLQQLLDAGMSAKDAAAQVARETGMRKQTVYNRVIAIKGRG